MTLLAAAPALGAEYYVSPDGSDDNDGSEGAPFATAARGQEAASAGDTVWFRGGVYEYSGNNGPANAMTFDKSGQSGSPINYWAFPGETPTFDFFDYTPQERIRGFSVRGDWLHFRGFEMRGVRQTLLDQNESWTIRVEGGSNNIFELLDIHDTEGAGFFIADGGNNLVLNVDSHHNYDPANGGENSDGFGCHVTEDGNVFRGCRGWWNGDDGYDFINSPGSCTVEYSWAFYNGFQPDSFTTAGNGAGFKAGGFTNNIPATIPRHVVQFNLSFGNRRQGFYANHHEGGIDWFNNTAHGNGTLNFDMTVDDGEGPATHFMRNNLASGDGGTIGNYRDNEGDDEFNSWNLGVSVSGADFLSTDDTGADGPRQANGSLPNIDFMKLAEGSDLIDAGEDQGFPFEGNAPDLGTFELGSVPDTGGDVGGVPGEGGAQGVGGATDTGGMGGTALGGNNAGGAPQGGANPMSGMGGTALGGNSAGGTPQGGANPMTGGANATAVANPSAGAPAVNEGGSTGVAVGGATAVAGSGAVVAMPGMAPTGSPTGVVNQAGDGTQTEDGCACRLHGQGSPLPRMLPLALLGLAAWWRRRPAR